MASNVLLLLRFLLILVNNEVQRWGIPTLKLTSENGFNLEVTSFLTSKKKVQLDFNFDSSFETDSRTETVF